MLRAAFFAGIVSIATVATATHVRAAAASMTAVYDSTTNSYTYTYTYNTTAPTDSNISNWQSGWGASDVTGWNYVGSDNGASAVYLGDGYVLSAGHVGAGNFILGGNTYDLIAGSSKSIGTADLTLFKIDTTSTTGNLLNLPTLSLETATPSVNSSIVMIGYGNGVGEAWATNTVYETNQNTAITSPTYDSLDIYTVDSFSPDGANTTITHDGQLVPGDSGGGDFIYNTTTHTWQLAGINEVLLQTENENSSIETVGSGMVQISSYSALIEADMAPEPPVWMLLGLGILSASGFHFWRQRLSPRAARA